MRVEHFNLWLIYGFCMWSLSSSASAHTILNDSTCRASIKQQIDRFFDKNPEGDLNCYEYLVWGTYQSGSIDFENSAMCYWKGKEFYQENAAVIVFTNSVEYILIDHTEKSISRINLVEPDQSNFGMNSHMLIRDSIIDESIIKECEIGVSGKSHCLFLPNYYWKTKSKAYSVEINISEIEYNVEYTFTDLNNISKQSVTYKKKTPDISMSTTGTLKDYIEKSIRTKYSNYEMLRN